MSKLILTIGGLFFLTLGIAQKNDANKTFWKEDFSEGKIPEGWVNKAENDSNIIWECTDQPFPGSYGHDQQAPPIASNSRGFHMQISPGTKTDKYYRVWKKKEKWPDAYLQTSAINCTGKRSVVLKFQQKFRWNNWGGVREDGGLFVGVSSNGKDWMEYDIRNGVGSDDDCANPMNVEINITAQAALQKTVHLRFYWKGIYAWYWMVDDIELSEALDTDLSAVKLSSHTELGNTFSKADTFRFKVVNLSAKEITTPFDCYLQVDNRPPIKTTVTYSTKNPFKIVDTVQVVFPSIDLTDYGIHSLKFYTALGSDSRKSNDTLSHRLFSQAYELGPVTRFSPGENKFRFECNHAQVIVQFYKNNLFRIQMSYNGEFTNPAGNDIVTASLPDTMKVKFTDEGDYYLMRTRLIALRAYKNPLRFSMYKQDNTTLVWEETKGLTYGYETMQYLKRDAGEYFYGGGMQNGRFSHREKTIQIRIDWNWEDGGNPNPAPFFMSTKGYGALRNTYAPGTYAFMDTVKLLHREPGFDCYYFAGESLKDILNGYTNITGRPFLPPRWGLSMGDANCYNRGAGASRHTTGYKGTTPDVIPLIADKYVENKMPRGWILPNDGYGCGYTKLDSIVIELRKRGFHTGLWTENGVEKIAREVGQYGSRLCKLDVAWVGNGYKFALDGCKAAYEGIENNSDARGFVWSVCGWAGTHRNSVVWTGDQKASWDYIRWHIPTVIGSGLSAQNCATGDIDAIFGGSDKTFTRDLQWKCFTPVLMSMSGWAPKDKQPYVFGEPYTSINRKYLMLKMQLTPYMYTLCNEAFETGVPAVRGLVLEYPEDPITLGNHTQYQFLLGKNLLVAPVYKDTNMRDSIYLPHGKWFDYWDGTIYTGGTFLNNYPAPLDKLPLFAKAGSVIPMYGPMYYDGERAADTLILDIYLGENSEFELFEDDGSTRAYRDGKSTKTKIIVQTGNNGDHVEGITIGAGKGNYTGKINSRSYVIQIHTKQIPAKVMLQAMKLKKLKDRESYMQSTSGWYFDPNVKNGVINIKTNSITTTLDTMVKLLY